MNYVCMCGQPISRPFAVYETEATHRTTSVPTPFPWQFYLNFFDQVWGQPSMEFSGDAGTLLVILAWVVQCEGSRMTMVLGITSNVMLGVCVPCGVRDKTWVGFIHDVISLYFTTYPTF